VLGYLRINRLKAAAASRLACRAAQLSVCATEDATPGGADGRTPPFIRQQRGKTATRVATSRHAVPCDVIVFPFSTSHHKQLLLRRIRDSGERRNVKL
jgi:hypothetical protein